MGLDLVEIVIEAEEEFNVNIDGRDPPLLVGDLLTAVIASIRSQSPESQLSDEDIWRRLQRMISEQLGVPIQQVTPSANFVTDLGCT